MSSNSRISKTVAKAVEALMGRLGAEGYLPGTALPSEMDLSAELNVSRGTVRKAIDILVASGDLTRLPHSRPIITDNSSRSESEDVRELMVWVANPVSDGPVLSFLRGVSRGLLGTPYSMVVREPSRFTGQVVRQDERKFLQDLLSNKEFGGAILWRSAFSHHEDLMRQLYELGKPIVYVDAPPPADVKGDYVGTANAASARVSVEHLFELGHTRIVFVADSDVPEPTQDRIRGYQRAMQTAGLAKISKVIIASDEKPLSGDEQRLGGPYARYTKVRGYFCDLAARAVDKILAMDPRPTAIFACHDILAISIYGILSGMGLRIPEDISLVGFDWIADSERTLPDNLTTSAQSFEGFGCHAANLVLDRASGALSTANRYVLLDAPLVIRSSTAPDLLIPAYEPARRSEGYIATK
jgi:LacI family transcriptional regulator